MNPRSPRRSRLPFLLAVACFAGAALPAIAAADKAPATLDDLAWIAGHWQGQKDGNLFDEQWSAPAGGAMTGMFRWIKDGRVQMYEFLAIESGPEGRPVLLLKHFHPGLVGWEEKGEVWRYPLTASAPREAVFTRPEGDTRMTFRRTSEQTLIVLLERQKDGKARTDEFVYTLVK